MWLIKANNFIEAIILFVAYGKTRFFVCAWNSETLRHAIQHITCYSDIYFVAFTKQQLLIMLCLIHSLKSADIYIVCVRVYARTFSFELWSAVRARAQHNIQYTALQNTINSCRFHCEAMSNSWKRYELQSVLRTCGVNKRNRLTAKNNNREIFTSQLNHFTHSRIFLSLLL